MRLPFTMKFSTAQPNRLKNARPFAGKATSFSKWPRPIRKIISVQSKPTTGWWRIATPRRTGGTRRCSRKGYASKSSPTGQALWPAFTQSLKKQHDPSGRENSFGFTKPASTRVSYWKRIQNGRPQRLFMKSLLQQAEVEAVKRAIG